MHRLYQILLIVSTAGLSWLGMMALHELGHVLHAHLSGGVVVCVVLHPLALSQTYVMPNPHPLLVAWGGAIWGCVIPLVVLATVRLLARTKVYLAAFFAGFCLIANGTYLTAGAFAYGRGRGVATLDDAGVILSCGGARWQVIGFGVVAMLAGLCLWHRLGPHFGLGRARGKVDRRTAVVAAVALVVVTVVGILFGRYPDW